MAAGGQQKGSNARPAGERGQREPQGSHRRTTRTEVVDEASSDPNAIQGDTQGSPPMDGRGVPLTQDEVDDRQAARQEQSDTHSSDLDLSDDQQS